MNLDQVELRQQYNWLCNIVPPSDEQEGLLNLVEHLLEEWFPELESWAPDKRKQL